MKGLHEHGIRSILTAHYGKWVSACPCSGMNLPELAAGLLDEILESIRLRNDRELREFCPPSAATPLTLDEWDLLFGDFHAAHQAVFALSGVKTDFIKRLPVSLAAIALADEDVARSLAEQARAAFMADPRKEVHDPRT